MGAPDGDQQATPTTSRRSFIAKAAGAAFATVLPASASTENTEPPTQTATKSPATQLQALSDDMRPELACYNSRFQSHSPNIDALAAKGVRSIVTTDNSLSATRRVPLCSPAIHPTPPKSSATALASATCLLTGSLSRSSSANMATQPCAAASSSTPAKTPQTAPCSSTSWPIPWN